MENGKHAHQFMPLVSRLDHLELIMKNLESKRNLGKLGSNSSSVPAVPLNLAVREAYFKGSLLDRVASLENRLFQLSLDLESSSTSSGTSVHPSSIQGPKKELSCSLPAFSNNNSCQFQNQVEQEQPPVHVNKSKVQGKYSKVVQQRRKKGSPMKEKGKITSNKDEKPCKSGKKRVAANWPHLKMFGC